MLKREAAEDVTTMTPEMWRQTENCSTSESVGFYVANLSSSPSARKKKKEFVRKFTDSVSELGIGPQAVELLRRRFFCSRNGRLAEAGSDIIKRPAFGLWHSEVGEDEEYEQQHDEDDKHVGTAELLLKHG